MAAHFTSIPHLSHTIARGNHLILSKSHHSTSDLIADYDITTAIKYNKPYHRSLEEHEVDQGSVGAGIADYIDTGQLTNSLSQCSKLIESPHNKFFYGQ